MALSRKKRVTLGIGVALLMLALGALYFVVDPAASVLMPKCPFRLLTGLDCPACGGQRALHSLLHGNFIRAILYNPFALYSIPYFLSVAYTTFSRDRVAQRLRPIVQGRVAVMIYVVLFCLWWVVRNTPLWLDAAARWSE